MLNPKTSVRNIIAMTMYLLILNGCILDNGQSYTEEIWEPEKISESRTNYTGYVSKISMGNIRPTIPGKSKKQKKPGQIYFSRQ